MIWPLHHHHARFRRTRTSHDHDGNVLHLVRHQMERAAGTPYDKEKWNIVIDFNATLKNTPLKTPVITLARMRHHYPGAPEQGAVDAPWLFLGAFKLISPFIDPVTRKKIVFVKVDA